MAHLLGIPFSESLAPTAGGVNCRDMCAIAPSARNGKNRENIINPTAAENDGAETQQRRAINVAPRNYRVGTRASGCSGDTRNRANRGRSHTCAGLVEPGQQVVPRGEYYGNVKTEAASVVKFSPALVVESRR